MLRKSCPKPEALLEAISIPGEMRQWDLFKIKFHLLRCPPCQENLSKMRSTWEGYFQPEPEIATSLLRVYSKLQRDETLVLKGWKLREFRSLRPSPLKMFLRSWGFPAGVAFSLGIFAILLSPVFQSEPTVQLAVREPAVPLSPIRVQDGNSVTVRYVQPQILRSMEFETVSTP